MPPRRKNSVDYYRCRETFGYTTHDGAHDTVHKGEIVPASDPLKVMKGREWAFEPITSFGRFDHQPDPVAEEPTRDDDIEQATAAPGEKRNR